MKNHGEPLMVHFPKV